MQWSYFSILFFIQLVVRGRAQCGTRVGTQCVIRAQSMTRVRAHCVMEVGLNQGPGTG